MTTAEQKTALLALDDAQLIVELNSVGDDIEEIQERLWTLNNHFAKVVDVVADRLGSGVRREANRRWCVEHGLTTLEDEHDD